MTQSAVQPGRLRPAAAVPGLLVCPLPLPGTHPTGQCTGVRQGSEREINQIILGHEQQLMHLKGEEEWGSPPMIK